MKQYRGPREDAESSSAALLSESHPISLLFEPFVYSLSILYGAAAVVIAAVVVTAVVAAAVAAGKKTTNKRLTRTSVRAEL